MFGRKPKTKELGPPSDVKEAFTRFVDGGTHLTPDQLRLFLIECQSDLDVTVSDAEKIIEQVMNRLHPHVQHPKRTLDLDDFFRYLFCDDLNGPFKTQVHHDMSAPLAHYFIFTGHNSYLTGNQLSSDCSDLPIIKALQMGVRVIELDLWPNSTKDDIDVLHGMTLTAPVPLIQCLKSIKEHAFDSSPYPCIITFEDHLTPDLQAKVADMVIETFGDLLYYPEAGRLNTFPSPESLKHRILISTKPPKEHLEPKGKEVEPSGKKDDDNGDSDLDDYDDDDDDDDSSNAPDPKSCRRRPPQYKHLITIHNAGKAKDGIQEALKVIPDNVRRLSLSESGLEKASTTYGTDIVRFTQMNILRVYPKGTRVTSSNYDPHVGWMHGAQMVAFNMQGYGKSLWLMHGMFRANGGCGYVKKPGFLMEKGSTDEIFDPKSSLPVKKTLKVKLYMGDGWHADYGSSHFDTFSPPEFYVKLKIVGAAADTMKKKSKTINDDWCPVWEEEFTFELSVPELALLQIIVKENDLSQSDDFAGQTCLPVSDIRPGFRTVPLYDEMGEKLKTARLLMRFELV